MRAVGRTFAIAYVVLAVVGASVLVQTGRNYVDVTDVILQLPAETSVSGIEINWTGEADDRPDVYVSVTVRNPGRVAVEVLTFEFQLHMDDLDDPRPFYERGKLEATFIRPGGFSSAARQGFPLPPGESLTLSAVVPVDPTQMDEFLKADAEGRYYPYVWAPSLVYTFVDFPTVVRKFFMAPYYAVAGVVPRG